MRASCALLETSLRHRAVGCQAHFFKGVSPPRGEVALAPEGADRQKAGSQGRGTMPRVGCQKRARCAHKKQPKQSPAAVRAGQVCQKNYFFDRQGKGALRLLFGTVCLLFDCDILCFGNFGLCLYLRDRELKHTVVEFRLDIRFLDLIAHIEAPAV